MMNQNGRELTEREKKKISKLQKAQKTLTGRIYDYNIVFSKNKKNEYDVYYICESLNIVKKISDKKNKSQSEKTYDIYDHNGKYEVKFLELSKLKIELYSSKDGKCLFKLSENK